jgi:hypothetical protein
MRRTMVIGLVLIAILAAVGIGVGAYNAGVSEGLQQGSEGGQVVRVVGPGYGFPFGLVLFPLFVVGIVLLLRGAFWRGRWGGRGYGPWGPGRPGPWGPGGPQRFEDWHRRQHEQPADRASGGGEPTGT